jgi:hypothetical protein
MSTKLFRSAQPTSATGWPPHFAKRACRTSAQGGQSLGPAPEMRWKPREKIEKIIEGLRLAGLPE